MRPSGQPQFGPMVPRPMVRQGMESSQRQSYTQHAAMAVMPPPQPVGQPLVYLSAPLQVPHVGAQQAVLVQLVPQQVAAPQPQPVYVQHVGLHQHLVGQQPLLMQYPQVVQPPLQQHWVPAAPPYAPQAQQQVLPHERPAPQEQEQQQLSLQSPARSAQQQQHQNRVAAQQAAARNRQAMNQARQQRAVAQPRENVISIAATMAALRSFVANFSDSLGELFGQVSMSPQVSRLLLQLLEGWQRCAGGWRPASLPW